MTPRNKKTNLVGAGEGKLPSPDTSGNSATDKKSTATHCNGLSQSGVLPQQVGASQTTHPDSHVGGGGGKGETDILASQADYCKRQAAMNRSYTAAYAEWLSGLSESELQVLKDHHVDKPEVGYHGKGAPNQDLADSPAASYEPDIAALVDGDREAEPEEASTHSEAVAIRHLFAYLLAQKNMRYTVECLALVLNLGIYDGEPMTAIAKRNKVTPAAVSKMCLKIASDLGIPYSRAMRRFSADESAKKAQLKPNRMKES